MTITNKQLNEYRTQGREIQVMLKALRRNIEKNDHQFYFASASTYGRVFTLFYNLIRNVYVFESVVQPPCHSGITGNYLNIKSFCIDIIRRFDELTYCLQGNEKYFVYLVAEVARSFFKVLTIKKEQSL
jgi:hypothetical protein